MPGYIEPNTRLLSKRVGFKIALLLFLEDFYFSISFIIMLRIPGLKRFIPPIRHVRLYHGKEGMYILFFGLLMKFSQYGCSIDAELENFLTDRI